MLSVSPEDEDVRVISPPSELNAAFNVLAFKNGPMSVESVDRKQLSITFRADNTGTVHVIKMEDARQHYALNKTFLFLVEADDAAVVTFICNQVVKLEGTPDGGIGFTFRNTLCEFLSDIDFEALCMSKLTSLMNEVLIEIHERSERGEGEWSYRDS